MFIVGSYRNWSFALGVNDENHGSRKIIISLRDLNSLRADLSFDATLWKVVVEQLYEKCGDIVKENQRSIWSAPFAARR